MNFFSILDLSHINLLKDALIIFIANPQLFLFTFLGVLLGMVVGILPGFGPPAAMAILFPFTYTQEPLVSLSLLAGIFYGAKYGGAVTSLLMGIPGETDSIATMLDGYPLAQKRPYTTLIISLCASFFGALFSFILIIFLGSILTQIAYKLSPLDRFLLLVFALLLVVLLTKGDKIKHSIMICLGFLLASIGRDPVHGVYRLSDGLFLDSLPLTPLLLGIFGICDILETVEEDKKKKRERGEALLLSQEKEQGRIVNDDLEDNPPAKYFFPALRGACIGFVTGLIPSGAGITATLSAYALEKKLEEKVNPQKKPTVAGLVAPESANNAAAIASFMPLLLLGLPTNGVMAALLVSLTVQGVVPSPLFAVEQPVLYWGFMASLLVGNVLLFLCALCFAPLWAYIARIPYRFLYPCIFILCMLAVYFDADSYSYFTLFSHSALCLGSGIMAFFLKKQGFLMTPFIIAFILSPKIETHLMQVLFIW